MSRVQYLAAEKLAIIQEIECGKLGLMGTAYKHGISKTTLVKWRRRYEVYGIEGLEEQTSKRSYSAEHKLQAVLDYLKGELSQYDIIDKYKIASRTQLSDWVKKYNCHSSLQTYKGRARAMTKGRSTTWQERMEIVQHCLIHNLDYGKTAEQHQVSYQQVYLWVRKYQDSGQDGLRDGRGRKKAEEKLTDADRQKLAMKKMEAEIMRLRAENAFLKKLEELERRRR